MKRIIVLILFTVLCSFPAFSRSTIDDNTAQELTVLRKKLGQVKREMDLLMRDIISNAPAVGETMAGNFGGDVSVDVLQNDKNVIVRADLPGMEKDNINIILERERFLKLSGTREVMKTEKSPGVVKQERFFGNFEKVVELPGNVTAIGISATYKDGVLEITIPKKAQGKEETVKINVK